jgi:hypothetical protein
MNDIMGIAKKAAIALIVLGIAVCAGFFFKSEDFTASLGLKWNLQHMEVVLKDKIDSTYMEVSEFRKTFPAYNDMDDEDLSLRLRTKYFSDMTLEEYRAVFLTSETGAGGAAGGDPVGIRADIDDLRVSDIFTRSIMQTDAIEYGLLTLTRDRVAFPYRYAFFAGLALVAAGVIALALSRKKRYNETQTKTG